MSGQEHEFAAPVLHGRRFQAHAVPLDVLKELEVYERLILDVAKAVFLARHPDRQRVPRGFEGRLKLSLRHVEPGSAMPVLLRSVEPPPSGQATLLPSGPDEFEEARDLIESAVRAAADGTVFPRLFPRSVLGRFNHFGRSLRSDEAIELRKQKATTGPKYTHAVRKKLVLMEEKSFSDTVDIVGRIYEADVEKGVFHIQTDAQKIAGSFTYENESVILAALSEHKRTRVRVIGTGRFDASDRLERVEEVEDVLLVDEDQLTLDDLRQRSEELKVLEDGWLDGDQGRALDAAALQRLTDVLADIHEQEEVPVPYLYPTPSGDVQAEWTIGSWELSATFKLASGDVELDAVDSQTGAGKEEQASTQTPEGRLALVNFVTSFRRKTRS